MIYFKVVIFCVFIYDASFSYAVDSGSIGGPIVVNMTDTMIQKCTELKKTVQAENKKCLEEFFNLTNESNCKTFQDVENKFKSTLNEVIECFSEEELKNMIKEFSSLKLKIMKVAVDGGKIKNFFGKGGLSCVNNTRKNINECIFETLVGQNSSHIRDSIVKNQFLYFSQPECSRGEKIFKCITEVVNKTCTKTSVDFILQLHRPLQERCDNVTNSKTINSSTATKKNSTGIIIGCLVAVIVILLAAYLIIRKLIPRKRRCGTRMQQSQSYNVSFKQNADNKSKE